MSNLELRIEEEASLNLTFGESSDISFSAVDFVGVPFAPTVEVEDIEGGHRVSITSMGAEGKKTDEFDVMDGADGATGPQGPKGDSYEITAADYAEIAEVVEEDIQDVIDAAESAASDATAAAAEARAASAATWLSGNVLFGELAEGAVLTTDDAFAAPPKSVEVFGKSTQSGTPTPDAPVAIQSVDNLTLNVAGKNLLTPISSSNTRNGITITPLADGRVRIDGTATASTGFIVATIENVQRGTYTLSGAYGNPDFYKNASMSANNRLFVRIGTTNFFDNSPNGVTFTTENLIPTNIDVSLVIAAGETLSNSVISPQLEYGSTATDYAPHTGQSVPVPLDQPLRSLPDGTRDTLTLSYIGPSETEGWGVFSKTLVQRAGTVDMGTLTWSMSTNYFYAYISDKRGSLLADIPNVLLCTEYQVEPVTVSSNNLHDGFVSELYGGTNRGVLLKNSNYTTAADLKASLSGAMLQYLLATPITHDLGTVELPVLPAPDLTAWADGGSAQPTMAMEYERALNIVIPRIEAAISDLATS